MATESVNYQCPSCMGPLHFEGADGKLHCDYCGGAFTPAEVEAAYAAKQQEADAAKKAEASNSPDSSKDSSQSDSKDSTEDSSSQSGSSSDKSGSSSSSDSSDKSGIGAADNAATGDSQ